jgi:hypothetical protein
VSPLGSTCESCERAPATVVVEFADGDAFETCKDCAEAALLRGGRPLVLTGATS